MRRPLARAYEPVNPDELERVESELSKLSQQLARRLGVRVYVDKEQKYVVIESLSEQGAANVLRARDVVKAIAIGFDASDASSLMDEDLVLVTVDVAQAVGGRENHLRRVMGRIIGEDGRAKRSIEQITGTRIVVNDRKGLVGIIGDYERAMVAKHGIDLLVEGKMHGTVYRILESMMRDLKRREFTELWFSPGGRPGSRQQGAAEGEGGPS